MDKLISYNAAINPELEELDFVQSHPKISVTLETSAQPVDEAYLIDWYINSVDDSEPVWTEAHIEELMNDFYIIPKET